jgi:hypothetical protein
LLFHATFVWRNIQNSTIMSKQIRRSPSRRAKALVSNHMGYTPVSQPPSFDIARLANADNNEKNLAAAVTRINH